MVDPNRKINRLTEKDIEFLDECQEEFSNRFTDEDADFYNHCSKPLADPPIVENWGYSGSSNSYRGSSGQRNNYGGGSKYNRGGWNKRGRDHAHGRGFRVGGGQLYRRNRLFNDNPTDRNFRGGNGREERPHQPMNVRRDYGNFVPASKD
ncbi:PREDICTED: RNMT-activating mini protein [Rhagoletis zephyria]|uniref:RNMT-activating mini protein n=1 Tax=Rhagoletis zephyria TaxID=28612 RepID=UPI00081152D3|nr:PREDICTED: RNMT-activating mini protein [Rhagoletis zephyria]